jgi:hypothetical protein
MIGVFMRWRLHEGVERGHACIIAFCNENHRPASMGGACWSERWQGHLIPVKGRAGVAISIYS